MNKTTYPADRQKHPRYQTFCSGKLYTGGRIVDCDVINISIGGAKVRLAQEIEVASQARLRIEGIGDFTGRIAWRDGVFLGIEFHDQLRDIARIVAEILSEDENHKERRYHPRTSVLWSGRLLCEGEATDCRILNISLRGALLRPDKPFKGGPEVIIHIDRFGQFAGSIVWQNDEQLGIEFLEEPEHIARVFGDAVIQLAATEQEQISSARSKLGQFSGSKPT